MSQLSEPDLPGDTVPVNAANPKPRYWGVLLFAGLIWGVTFSMNKVATAGGAHPIGLNIWQSLLGFVILLVFVLFRGRRIPLTRKHLSFYAVCGFFGTALPGVLYFYAAIHVPAGVLAITLATVPMLTLFLALAMRHERPMFSRGLGIVLGIIGVALVVLPESGLPDRSAVPWVLIAVVSALCYAIENMIIALRMPPDVDPMTVLCGMLGMGAAMTVGAALLTDSFYVPVVPFTAVEGAVVAIAVVNVIAYGLFIYLINRAGPVFASQMAYVVTLSGIAWGIVLFGEQHSVWIWAALVVLMAGIALVKPRSDDDVA
ncbi:MAG: DMT family transporter [Hyphomicrobiaceae bacterium]